MNSPCKTTQNKAKQTEKEKDKKKKQKKNTDSEAQEKRGTNQIRYFIMLFLHSIKYVWIKVLLSYFQL